MISLRAAFEPSPSRGGLGGDGVAILASALAIDCKYPMNNTIPTQTLPISAILASLGNPALRILLRAFSSARTRASQARCVTPLKGRASERGAFGGAA